MDGDEIVDTEIVETETNFILTHAQEVKYFTRLLFLNWIEQ